MLDLLSILLYTKKSNRPAHGRGNVTSMDMAAPALGSKGETAVEIPA
ncbi:MAG: hypothetical protein LBD29_11225 [Treponema sp.]|nr:hypothetical protein [Treponema sp.]